MKGLMTLLGIFALIFQINLHATEGPIQRPPIADFNYYVDGTYLELRLNYPKTDADISSIYYMVDNTTRIDLNGAEYEFLHGTRKGINLSSLGAHSVTIHVEDVNGQVSTRTENFIIETNPNLQKPVIRLGIAQSNIRTLFVNMAGSFIPLLNRSITEYTINMGDGNIYNQASGYLTHTYATTGTYTITYTIKNGSISSTTTRTVAVTDDVTPALNPVPAFSYNIYNFAQNVSFYKDFAASPNGAIVSYLWEFGDNTTATGENVAHFYNPGTYFVKLTVTDIMGKTSSRTQKIVIVGTGNDIAANLNCTDRGSLVIGCSITAIDKLNDINRVRVVWIENVAAFDLPLIAPPFDQKAGAYGASRKFSAPGTYPIKLVINTGRTFTRAITQNVTVVTQAPVSMLSCFPNNMFVGCSGFGSYSPDGLPLTYTMNWGDGITESSNQFNFYHTYTTAGLYTATLTVSNPFNVSSVSTFQYMVFHPSTPNILPIANLDCTPSRPFTLICNAQGSTDQDGYIVNATYEFDDGRKETFDINHTFEHTFLAPGAHSVTLSVLDSDGGVSTVTNTYEVLDNKAPIVSITCQSLMPFQLSCYSDVNDEDGFILDKKWYIDNELTSFNDFVFTKTFSSASIKNVKMVVTDDLGKVGEAFFSIELKENASPVATIDCFNVGIQKISCQNFSYDPDGQIASVLWELEDGFSTTNPFFTHVFEEGPSQQVKLTVTDNFGKQSTSIMSINIIMNMPPSFELFADKIVASAPALINFKTKNANDIDGQIVSYEWSIDNVIKSSLSDFSNVLDEPGVYEIKLRVSDDFGAVVEKNISITIVQSSILKIVTNVDSGVAPLSVTFDASESSSADSVLVKYEWFNNEIKIGEGVQFSYSFDVVGNNEIELYATDSLGIKSKLKKNIHVENPELYVSSDYEEDAFVGIEYVASLNVSTQNGVSDDVNISFINKPSSMIYDEDSKVLRWIPSNTDVGIIEFDVYANDNINHFTKKMKINVYQVQKIATVNSPSGNGGIVETNLGEGIGNTRIYHPNESSPYVLHLYKSLNSPKLKLLASVDGHIKNELNISFDKEVSFTEKSNTFFHQMLDVNPNTYIAPAKFKIKTSNFNVCAGMLKTISFSRESESDGFIYHSSKPIMLPSNDSHVEYYVKDKASSLDLINIHNAINVINGTSFEFSHLKFYFEKNFLNYDKKYHSSLAMVSSNTQDSIIINVDAFNSLSNDMIKKYVLHHEGFHIHQNRTIGCLKYERHVGHSTLLTSFIEGSADYYSFRKLNSLEQKEVVAYEYKTQYRDNPFLIYQKATLGFLDENNFKYASRVVWEFLPFNVFKFIDEVGKYYRQDPKTLSNEDTFQILNYPYEDNYPVFGSRKFSDGLVNFTNYYNNYYRLDFVNNEYMSITGLLYDKDKFLWRESMLEIASRNINLNLNGAKKGEPKALQLTIPPMTGVSRFFTNLGTDGKGNITSQLNEMIKFTNDNPNGVVTTKIFSVLELASGAVRPLRNFTYSTIPSPGGTSIIGSRSNNFNSSQNIEGAQDWGYNLKGLEYYNLNSALPPSNFTTDLNNGYGTFPNDQNEKIILNFFNNSLEPVTINVFVEPLCVSERHETVYSPTGLGQGVNYNCDVNCRKKVTANVCVTESNNPDATVNGLCGSMIDAIIQTHTSTNTYFVPLYNGGTPISIDVYQCYDGAVSPISKSVGYP